MTEVEIIGTFDTEETARSVSKALNAFFLFLTDDERDDNDVPQIFEDFGVTTEDFVIDADELDWPEAPRVRVRGPKITITIETELNVDSIGELMESLGAFDVSLGDEDEEEED
jgi:hypothetical protein